MIRRNPTDTRLRRLLLAMLLVGVIPPTVFVLRRKQQVVVTQRVYRSAEWAAGDLQAVRADADPPDSSAVWDGEVIRVAGMRNEVVAWQLIVRPAYYVDDARLTIAPLVSSAGVELPADHLEPFHAHLMEITVPSQYGHGAPVAQSRGAGKYPNQLLPFVGERVVDLPAGEAATLWFDYWIPPDAAPGVYRSTITLADDRTTDLSFPLELEVWDLDMPRAMHYRTWFVLDRAQLVGYIGGDALLGGALESRLMRLAREHRASAVAPLTVAGPQVDLEQWWAVNGAIIAGQLFADGPTAGERPPLLPLELPELSATDFRDTIVPLHQELRDRGLLDGVVLVEPRSPRDEDDYRRVQFRGAMLDEYVGRGIPYFVVAPVTPPQERLEPLTGYVDWFCTGRVSEAERRAVRALEGEVWVQDAALGGVPVIDVPLLGVAAWGPAAWRYRVDGQRIWNLAYWRQTDYDVREQTALFTDPLTVDEARRTEGGRPYPAEWAVRLNGDGVMVYPGDLVGSSMLVPSLRLKAFRRGAQLYEYLWLLRQKGRGKAAEQFATRLVPAAGQWNPDPTVWEQTRREMAKMLLELTR